MVQHLIKAVLLLTFATLVISLPVSVELAKPAVADIESAKNPDSVESDDLDTDATAWGGIGFNSWYRPSYHVRGWGNPGYYGGGRGHGGWGRRGYGGWGRGYGGYGKGWGGYRGGYWW